MSLQDFWISVRTGARLLAPSVTADSPRINSADVERLLQGAVIWLTPKSVEGFDPQDFDFLSQEERDALTHSVDRFLDIARQVPADKPAPSEKIQQALPEFRRIVEIVAPNKYADPEAFRIGKKLEQQLAGRMPTSVLELRFETGQDSHGGEGLWIWVIFKDEVAKKRDVLLSNIKAVRELLDAAIRGAGIKIWPYVRFRIDADLEPLAKQKVNK